MHGITTGISNNIILDQLNTKTDKENVPMKFRKMVELQTHKFPPPPRFLHVYTVKHADIFHLSRWGPDETREREADREARVLVRWSDHSV